MGKSKRVIRTRSNAAPRPRNERQGTFPPQLKTPRATSLEDTVIKIPDIVTRERGDTPLDEVQQVSIEWAAFLLDCNTRTIRRMVEQGKLRATGRNTGLKITVASIREYLRDVL